MESNFPNSIYLVNLIFITLSTHLLRNYVILFGIIKPLLGIIMLHSISKTELKASMDLKRNCWISIFDKSRLISSSILDFDQSYFVNSYMMAIKSNYSK